jgi:predicted XRE-type DNA-binding protein
MEMAVRVVEGREMSQHVAAKYYGVPKSTLNDRIKGKVKLDAKSTGHTTL